MDIMDITRKLKHSIVDSVKEEVYTKGNHENFVQIYSDYSDNLVLQSLEQSIRETISTRIYKFRLIPMYYFIGNFNYTATVTHRFMYLAVIQSSTEFHYFTVRCFVHITENRDVGGVGCVHRRVFSSE